MCHNHSHARMELAGSLIMAKTLHGVFETIQPFTIEMPTGAKLQMPAGSTVLIAFSTQADCSAFLEALMVEQSVSIAVSDPTQQ